MKPLRLLSYLAPSIPEGLFERVANAFRSRVGAPVEESELRAGASGRYQN